MPEIYDFPYQKPEQPEVLPEPETPPSGGGAAWAGWTCPSWC